jgi:hypothetical protein
MVEYLMTTRRRNTKSITIHVALTSKEKSQISCRHHVVTFYETIYFYCQNLTSTLYKQTAYLLKVEISSEHST